MKESSRIVRQSLGCGYEPTPAPELVQVRTWQPPKGRTKSGDAIGYQHEEKPTTCPGYTTRLPEVYEVAIARRHWKQGALALHLGDAPATDQLMTAIVLLDNEFSALERYVLTPAADGGGGR